MMVAGLNEVTLGYLSGVLGAIIAVALVVSLTIVNSLVRRVGGSGRGHVQSIQGSLVAVSNSTDPVPSTLRSINDALTELAQVLGDVEGHLRVARTVFDRVSQG